MKEAMTGVFGKLRSIGENRDDQAGAAKAAPAPAAAAPAPIAVRTGLQRPPIDFKELTDDIRQTLMQERRKVLSGDETKLIQLPSTAHSLLCILEGGVMVVSQSHLNVPSVKEAMTRAAAKNVEIKEFYSATMQDVRDLAESVSSSGFVETDTLEKMQKEVIALLDEAVKENVTDIQIHVTAISAKVRYCINDQFVDVREMPAEYGRQFLTCMYNLATGSNDGTDKPGEHQKARVSSKEQPLPGNLESVRLQMSPTAGDGRVTVARLLFGRRQRASMKTLDALGYDPEHLITLERIKDTPFGVVFVAGPTGSGKSTTLAVIMEQSYKDREGRANLVSIEDPAEYAMAGVIQYQVTNATDEDERRQKFQEAFSAVLRSKPHIIMVGEVRDGPAAKMLFQAAQSGHLSYSTVHAKDALTIPMRLKEMGVDPFMLKDDSVLVGVVFQRLLPTVCKHCALSLEKGAEIILTQNQREFVDTVTDYNYRPLRFRNKKGCEECAPPGRRAMQPGISGQTVVAEVIQPTESMLHAIMEGRRNDAIDEWLKTRDAITAFEHAIRKMWNGLIDPRDVFEKVYDRHQLMRLKESSERRRYVREGLKARPDAMIAEPRPLNIKEGDDILAHHRAEAAKNQSVAKDPAKPRRASPTRQEA